MAGQLTGPCIEGQCLPGLMCFVDKCQPGGNNTQGASSQPPDDTSETGETDTTGDGTGVATAASNPTANSSETDPTTTTTTTTGDTTITTGPTTTGVDRTTGPSTSDWPSSDTDSDSNSFITSDSGDDSNFIRPPDDPCEVCTVNEVCVVIDDVTQCNPKCDPLNQAYCGPGNECVNVDDQFACVPDASGNTGKVGDGCIYANGCDPGNLCLTGSYVAGCNGQACCSAFCDTDLPDPCAQYDMQCVPWFEMGMAPTGLEDVGICVIP